jgi:glycosyltransferase involved in cell wall biosynthesis
VNLSKIPIKHFSEFKSELSLYKDKRVAFVHQSFWKMRGGERMVKSYYDELPNAEVYALFGDRSLVNQEFGKGKVKFTVLQYIPFIKYLYRYSIPLWPFVFRFWNFKNYDLIISFSSSFAKGVKTDGKTKHWAIVMTPPRYLWDLSSQYYKAAHWLRRIPMFLFYTLLRIFDADSAGNPDRMIAISKFTAKRIQKYYGRTPDEIIYPPVDVPKSVWEKAGTSEREDYFIAISPFEENKGGEKLFEMAKECGFKLKVIGGGNLLQIIKKKYGNCGKIEFLGAISDDSKWEYYLNSSGLLMLGVEDLGTIQMESVAAGCPVIAYGRGGVLETLSEGVNAVFIDKVNVEAVNKVVIECQESDWDIKEMQESIKDFVNFV